MILMTSGLDDSDVNDVARMAGLDQAQTDGLRNIAASWAMEGMTLAREELQVAAELAAGRIGFAEARHRLGV